MFFLNMTPCFWFGLFWKNFSRNSYLTNGRGWGFKRLCLLFTLLFWILLKRLIFATSVGKDPSECAGRRPLSHFAPSEIPPPPTPPPYPLPRNQALAGPAASSGPQLCGSAGRGFARSCFWSPSTRWSRSRSTPTTWWTPTWPAGVCAIFAIFLSTRKHTEEKISSSWGFELTTACFEKVWGWSTNSKVNIALLLKR